MVIKTSTFIFLILTIVQLPDIHITLSNLLIETFYEKRDLLICFQSFALIIFNKNIYNKKKIRILHILKKSIKKISVSWIKTEVD